MANVAKVREFLWCLAECHSRRGDLAQAEAQLRELLRMQLASHDQRLEALCFLADIQVPSSITYTRFAITGTRFAQSDRAFSKYGAILRLRPHCVCPCQFKSAAPPTPHPPPLPPPHNGSWVAVCMSQVSVKLLVRVTLRADSKLPNFTARYDIQEVSRGKANHCLLHALTHPSEPIRESV